MPVSSQYIYIVWYGTVASNGNFVWHHHNRHHFVSAPDITQLHVQTGTKDAVSTWGVGQSIDPDGDPFPAFINTLISLLILSELLLFIDDIYAIENLDDAIDRINADWALLVVWARTKDFFLILDKAFAIVFGSSHNQKKI